MGRCSCLRLMDLAAGIAHQTLSKLASANVELMIFNLFLCFAYPFALFRFWCHFDDDNYVNIPTLVRVLKEYHAYQDWYLGKPSISSPIEMFLNPVSAKPCLSNDQH